MTRPDDHEDLLRTVLHDEAATLHPRPDWDDVTRRAGRDGRGARRWALPAGVAAAAAAVVVAVALAGGGEEATDVTTEPAPVTVPAPTTAEEPDPDPSPGAGPVTDEVVEPIDLPAGEPLGDLELVALVVRDTDDVPIQDLVVIDPDGDVTRTLVPGIGGAEGGAYHLALTPDRRTLLFSEGTSACTSIIRAVPVDGSEQEQTLFEGNQVAVSPDGRWLALDPRATCEPDDEIELLPIGGGVKLRFGREQLSGLPERAGDGGINDLAWADDDTLLYAVSDPGGESTVHVLDVGAGTSLPHDATGPGSLTSLEPAPTGGVISISACCAPGPLEHWVVFLAGAGEPRRLDGPASHATMTPALGYLAIDAGTTTLRTEEGIIRTDVVTVVG